MSSARTVLPGARAVLGVVVVATLVLTGCAATSGLDADLTDDWAALAPPVPFTPAAATCHEADFTEVVSLTAYQPVDCAGAHRVETAHVGTFPADRPRPPTGSAQLRTAFADCDTRATGYVGHEWRGARLRLGVAIPSPDGWSGGARWYRCDLTEVTTVEAGAGTVLRTGSLRGALRGPSPLKLGCQQAATGRGGGVSTLSPVSCDKRHNAEYVGVWAAPDRPYPARDAEWAPFYTGCRTVLARYVGVPDDIRLTVRSGVVVRPPAAGRWRAGDRGVRCYLWLSHRTTTGSLAGAGPAGLPVRTG
ncbi:septum formation family protein [Micromonospora yangpuensis]|uniref:Septum formation n=1 Tax=Micromonospora yangpuensis TaxID=683228 RepID=A0A1C6VG41_9ACTN|nr:septum formation family protein [Micromonospora yangpuensis]GGM30162.1 hypothetical protein GCM10012279_56360 [Micromonospora yangpuensis]SCL64850.1 Septum formation [Micromonospora yangpuensis]